MRCFAFALAFTCACFLGIAVTACSSSSAAPAATAPATNDAGTDGAPTTASGDREITTTTTFDTNGISSPVTFSIPEKTRSVTIVVEGETTRLYGLASFVMSEGVDLVGVDLETSHAAEMKRTYFDEQVGAMPGSLDQSIRLGTFTHVYPHARGQSVTPGTATVRIASDGARDGASATVKVIMPDDDGANVLHLNVVRVSETAQESSTPSSPPPFVETVRTIFEQAGIAIVVDEVLTLPGTGYAKIESFTEPQEAPDSDAAKLATIVGAKTRSTALDVMIVDSLTAGVAGLSLGVPGPPVPGSYYHGVVIADAADAAALGRVVAHEVAHFLGLQHVTNQGTTGKVYEDPLDDTKPTLPNLMTKGTELTPGQIFVLGRSPLLTK